MELLEKGVRRVRRSLVFNAFAGFILWLVMLFGGLMIEETEVVVFYLVVVGVLYLAWVVTMITAIVFQYGGAIALVRAKKKENPPNAQLLFVAGILIIVDPLFNLLSLIGMILIPAPFMKERYFKIFVTSIVLFVVAGFGTAFGLVNYIPGIGEITAVRVIALALGAAFKVLNVCAYMLLYRVYRSLKLPTEPAEELY